MKPRYALATILLRLSRLLKDLAKRLSTIERLWLATIQRLYKTAQGAGSDRGLASLAVPGAGPPGSAVDGPACRRSWLLWLPLYAPLMENKTQNLSKIDFKACRNAFCVSVG